MANDGVAGEQEPGGVGVADAGGIEDVAADDDDAGDEHDDENDNDNDAGHGQRWMLLLCFCKI